MNWWRKERPVPALVKRPFDYLKITFIDGSARTFQSNWNDEAPSDDNDWLHVTEWFIGELPHLVLKLDDYSPQVFVVHRSQVRSVQTWREFKLENA